MPIQVAYCLMALVVPFYMLFNRQGYRSIYQLGRRLGYPPIRDFLFVYRNHFRFGQIILDRFRAYAGKKFQFTFEGLEQFNSLEESPSGFVQLSSHVGNYEMAGYALTPKGKRLNALVYAGETETVMHNRERMLSAHNMTMIPVRNDMSHLFLANNALDDGEIVSLPADRLFGSTKHIECLFFGQKASFPMGPFAMAASKGVPALAVFVMKRSTYSYHIIVRQLERDPESNIRTQSATLAQSFAEALESVVRRYPEQWFNYFDFFESQHQ